MAKAKKANLMDDFLGPSLFMGGIDFIGDKSRQNMQEDMQEWQRKAQMTAYGNDIARINHQKDDLGTARNRALMSGQLSANQAIGDSASQAAARGNSLDSAATSITESMKMNEIRGKYNDQIDMLENQATTSAENLAMQFSRPSQVQEASLFGSIGEGMLKTGSMRYAQGLDFMPTGDVASTPKPTVKPGDVAVDTNPHQIVTPYTKPKKINEFNLFGI